MAASDDNVTSFDPGRRLCPDGSCIGIIGSDGRCTVCGRTDAGGPAPADPTGADAEDDGSPAPETQSDDPAEASIGFNPNRRLCSDDSCIGVIGADNRCTECGKPAEG